jgi:hypothetical protein
LPQIFAGGALGHDPFGAGGTVVDCVGAGAAVVGGAVVTVGFGAGGAVVVGGSVGVSVGVAVGVGGVLGVVALLLETVKVPRRLEVVPSDHVMTVLMVCDPSASFVVSYGVAEPSAAVPAKSYGGSVSVRTGGSVRRRLSR